jgi:hypothetical protein
MFHDFVFISRITGNRVTFTAIGKTREDALAHLKTYSLKDLDWSRWIVEGQ